jgi:outer membrane receptor protein involved in Fe transport
MANNKVVGAVKFALAASAASAVLPIDAPLAQQAPQADATATNAMPEEVIVTGTRVRRVDAETASPIFVIDQAQIAQSGAVTVGDLVSRIPAINGFAINPSVNNGGGFGESNIELRGLDAKRTLILLDGRRINLAGNSGSVDVNQIPINLIERVDVLKEGAGAIYGSDAIAGVVNFITKKTTDGIELTGDWGQTTKHDAQHHNLGLIFGTTTDRASFQVGMNYNQQDELTMAKRSWSRNALYLYSGAFSKGGSSRTPTGRIFLSSTTAVGQHYGCGSITRVAGAAGTALGDFRCFQNPADKFNFQPFNLNLTPQERGALFSKMNYRVSDYFEAYGEVVYNHTHSGFQLAPLPFDALNDNIIISKNNLYNPFGIDFGGPVNNDIALRMSSVGNRRSDTASASLISTFGLKGKIGETGWRYDGNVSYNRLDQTANVYGYLDFGALQNAVGPSFIGPGGVPTCGTVAAPIGDCVPANFFNLSANPAALANISSYYTTQNTFKSKTANLDMNGTIVKMPAGDLLGSVGVSYTGLEGAFQTSSITTLKPPDFLHCAISQEACSGDSSGYYNVKEIYAELFVPILHDVPGAADLNIDVGGRYSKYSLFGSTNRLQFKLEYRPVKDLLVRGTYAQIFRAPTIADISAAPAVNAPTLNDLCNGYTGANTAAYPHLQAACVGVPTTGNFQEPQNQVTGVITSNMNLSPEKGDVKTFGLVYDPSYVRGLSLSADYWDYKVDGQITTLDPNYTMRACATTGDPAFCSLLHRLTVGSNAGLFLKFEQPTVNLGLLKTKGVDIGLRYQMRDTGIGDLTFAVDGTHLLSWTNTPAPGLPSVELAGTEDKQFGFYAKNRGTASINWSQSAIEAMVTARYVSGVDIPLTNFNFGTGLFGGYHLGSVVYVDVSAGYNIKATNTSLRVGILNLTDKDPPIGGINSFGAGSSVTDVGVYDTVGRRYFVGFTQKF